MPYQCFSAFGFGDIRLGLSSSALCYTVKCVGSRVIQWHKVSVSFQLELCGKAPGSLGVQKHPDLTLAASTKLTCRTVNIPLRPCPQTCFTSQSLCPTCLQHVFRILLTVFHGSECSGSCGDSGLKAQGSGSHRNSEI